MKFDYSNLRGEMARQKVRLADLSQRTGISVGTLSTKMAHGLAFSCDQAWRIAQVLNLSDMNPYFFAVVL